jgi:hypothetical protein
MKIIYNKKDKEPDQSEEKGENRFSCLIKNLDTQDRGLDTEKRKRKWIYILAGLFFLYLASFLVPIPELSHQSLEPVNAAAPKEADISGPDSQKSLTFEMPVDSFENILKKSIHEKLPEKK